MFDGASSEKHRRRVNPKCHVFWHTHLNDLKLQCSLDFENDKMIWISLWVWDKRASPNDEMIHIYHQELDRNKKMESLRYPWGTLTLGETDSSRDVRVKNVLVELK